MKLVVILKKYWPIKSVTNFLRKTGFILKNFQSNLSELESQVQTLFGAGIQVTNIGELGLEFYLLNDGIESREYSPEQVEDIWANMPYWAFAWSSGRALAKYILDNPELVKNKVVADFGAGSGIVALAAMKAGAKAAWVCDIDKQALLACQVNAELNGFNIHICNNISQAEDLDLLVVGDVLYDPRNHKLADTLFNQALPVVWAESQAQTKLSEHGPVAAYEAQTQPNIGGFDEHKNIHNVHLDAMEHGDKIVFLHAVKEGPANQSYGLQVASLAGVPSVVIDNAKAKLRQLEDNAYIEQQQDSGTNQLDLFSTKECHPAVCLLEDISPDDLSPRAALDLLYKLKECV